MQGQKIYFASDFHLGVPNFNSSLEREKAVCLWLDMAGKDAAEIFLVGDMFDFWYEHKYTVPKGQTRFLGKIAQLTDAGIRIHFFTGNHDIWMKDYFTEELGVSIHREPIRREFNGKQFLIGHGDGLGPGDNWYKLLKIIFTSKLCWWLYSRLHPNFSFWLAKRASKRSRVITAESDEKFLGEENEWLYLYSKEYVKKEKVDYLIFGHRHLPLEMKVDDKATYFNLGEWINHRTYAVFDGTTLKLEKFKG